MVLSPPSLRPSFQEIIQQRAAEDSSTASTGKTQTPLGDITWLILYVSVTLSGVGGLGIEKKLERSLSF